jgi:hypothetical protein
MIRRVIGIVLYIFAGGCFYMANLMAFVADAGLVPIILFAAFGVLALVAGLAIMGFQDWKRDTGLVLLSAVAFTMFMLLLGAGNNLMRLLDPSKIFGNYITGAPVLVVLALAGAILVWTSRKPRTIA